ncbi:hypothetical protein SBC1_53390 (plasmid) [Caballeronia sp. SBC1]|nr:hypothetical protein SBC2_52970 [Caballeronia sp. SBC2]QIN65294.1 hypothetical protein SBC1_53390 [Caballeronia sp. SBC1]
MAGGNSTTNSAASRAAQSLVLFNGYRDPGDTYKYAQFYNFDPHSGSYFILQQTFTSDGLNRLSHEADDSSGKPSIATSTRR